MTTDNKYYTPSPGDFCEGLEYQFRYSENIRKCRLCGGDLMTKEGLVDGCVHGGSYISNMDAYEWKDAIFNVVDGLGDDDFEKEYRVKRLDMEDIESSGFKFLETNGMRQWYIKENLNTPIPSSPDQKYWEVSLIHDSKLNTLKVLSRTSNNEIETFFEGTINNKSELIKLMKQLNINEQKPLLENNP